jgi:predicted phosphoribosyltransferase
MFRNREQAAHELAQRLNNRIRWDPLVLAIAGGGVVTGAALAQELGAGFDIVLSRRLRALGRPSRTIGALSEGGHVYLDPLAKAIPALTEKYLAQEISQQLAALAHQKRIFRKVQPPVQVAGRSVVVADDGIQTGATMIAAL